MYIGLPKPQVRLTGSICCPFPIRPIECRPLISLFDIRVQSCLEDDKIIERGVTERAVRVLRRRRND